jgi:hypothetical protein
LQAWQEGVVAEIGIEAVLGRGVINGLCASTCRPELCDEPPWRRRTLWRPFRLESIMPKGYRFGRRLALPSTLQIRHELRLMDAQEEGRKRLALADGLAETASWDEIGSHRARAEREAELVNKIAVTQPGLPVLSQAGAVQ